MPTSRSTRRYEAPLASTHGRCAGRSRASSATSPLPSLRTTRRNAYWFPGREPNSSSSLRPMRACSTSSGRPLDAFLHCPEWTSMTTHSSQACAYSRPVSSPVRALTTGGSLFTPLARSGPRAVGQLDPVWRAIVPLDRDPLEVDKSDQVGGEQDDIALPEDGAGSVRLLYVSSAARQPAPGGPGGR